jgi:multiple sugar transport system substrate-binding protein
MIQAYEGTWQGTGSLKRGKDDSSRGQGYFPANPEAAQLRIEANWELPAITDQALLDSWVEQTPPESRHLVFEALETLVTPPPFTNQALVQDELDTLFQQVLAGELTAEEALTEAVPRIEEVLSE